MLMMHHEMRKIRRGSTGYMSVTRRVRHSSLYRFAYRSSRDATEGIVSKRSPNDNIRLTNDSKDVEDYVVQRLQ